jgi:hypothetical protein
MHALFIIMLTPLAIMLGLVILGLVFTPWVWKAVGYLILGVIGLMVIAVLVPKAPPVAAPVAAPQSYIKVIPQAVIDARYAERVAREQWIKASGVDYPYMRAYAGVERWSKILFEEQLAIARRTKAPANAIHTQAGDWLTTDDIARSPMLSLLDSVVRCDKGCDTK